jgi:RNA polymerase sigma factor (sigma-70 family)
MSAQPPIYADDLELVARIVSGNEEAADEFARRYYGLFEHLARQSKIPLEDSRDVAQEALIDAYRQLRRGSFQGRSSLGTWTGKIIKGKIADYWRKQSRSLESEIMPAPSAAEEDDDPWESLIRKIPDLAAGADLNIRLDVITALKKMETMYRVILLLNRTLGYTIEEISRMTRLTNGLTPAQIATRLITAQKMFRRLLAGYDEKPGASLIKALPAVTSGSDELVVEGDDNGSPEQTRAAGACRAAARPGAGLRAFITVLRSRTQRFAHGLLLWTRQPGRAAAGERAFDRVRSLPPRSVAIGSGGARA